MVRIKVCGITTPEDGLYAVEMGADAIGLVFAPESPRRVGIEKAAEISGALPERVLRVGVFVNEKPERVLGISREAGLDVAQLHGEESPEEVEALCDEGLTVIKAIRLRDDNSLGALSNYAPDLFLLDAFSREARGGTGERFDWALAEGIRGYDNIVISGGLSAENVAEAVEFFRPGWVDASSALEASPGVKEAGKIRRFVGAARDG